MSKLHIYIPTRGRVDRQYTMLNLPYDWASRTTLVCPPAEVEALTEDFPMAKVVGFKEKNIAEKRAFIFRWAQEQKHDKIIMLDDDLSFSVRNRRPVAFAGFAHASKYDNAVWERASKIDPTLRRLRIIRPDDLDDYNRMFGKIASILDLYRHAGISVRYFNQSAGHEWHANRKLLRALAYHVPTVMKHCELYRVKHFEDVEYTLQLLQKGFPCAEYRWAATNEVAGFNAPGGASIYRTGASLQRETLRMKELYPDLITLRETNTGDGDEYRQRMIIHWKRAFRGDLP